MLFSRFLVSCLRIGGTEGRWTAGRHCVSCKEQLWLLSNHSPEGTRRNASSFCKTHSHEEVQARFVRRTLHSAYFLFGGLLGVA
ncbi:hypothetical protein NDU88_006935 [Pleurodeles waltl]|uniref:Secreted protein n=1 Tax=Pleurodeles waltl TaxID=8319 RepID=A0AAV7TYA1_PLEWA|nr:hypothetical protein NDU88_006935 [Pleurodeles waltl]